MKNVYKWCLHGFAALALILLCMILKPEPSFAETYKGENDMYQDHYYMSSRGFGSSEQMKGDIELLLVFVNDSESSFTQEDKDAFISHVFADTDHLQAAAAEYGTDLSFSLAYFDACVPREKESDWYNYLMETYFHAEQGLETLQKYYEKSFGKDDTPLLFIFNKEGRCYTYQGSTLNRYRDEYSVFFTKSMGAECSIIHEFLHLYGAHDYYFPQAVKDSAEKYFSASSMLTGGREVDEFTAFMIGWTDRLSDASRQFLNETSWLNEDAMAEALRAEWN